MAGPLTLRMALRPRGRRGALALLGAGVLLAHLGALNGLLEDHVGWGDGAAAQKMRRMEVAYVRDLVPALPVPVVVPAVVPPPAPAAAAAPAPRRPASAPLAPPEPEVPPLAEPPPPEPLPPPVPEPAPRLAEPASAPAPAVVADASPAAPAPVAASAAAPAASDTLATAFEWPPSTRLSYELRGNYRGEVSGSAQVEWIRAGSRYQVHMEALVGPSFAPLLARRIHSEGELTERGLVPQRFEGEQRVGFTTRRWDMQFTPQRVRLANGAEVANEVGAQDEASQFVQLAWLFTVRPELLAVGKSVDIPLALPRRLERWVYDAVEEETVQLPFGPLPTVHLKPRRGSARAGDLVVEMWFAPTLQYLPVRILIRQDASNYIDLALKRAPEQSAR